MSGELAVSWAALGILAAFSFGGVFYLASKIDRLVEHVSAVQERLSGLEAKLDAHVELHRAS